MLALGLLALAAPAASEPSVSPPLFLESWATVGAPLGLALDAAGNVLVADDDPAVALRKHGPHGEQLAEFGAGAGFVAYGVALLSDAAIVVTDYFGSRVLIYSSDGTLLDAWSTGGETAMYVAVDAADHVYVTDVEGSQIRKFTRAGALVANWAANQPTGIVRLGAELYVAERHSGMLNRYDLGGASLGAFPVGLTDAGQVASDSHGRLYVVGEGTRSIECFDPSGALLWGVGALDRPHQSVAVSADGRVFVGDPGQSRVRVSFPQYPTDVRASSWGSVRRRFR